MNLKSKYFDSIRVRRGKAAPKAEPVTAKCQWNGCDKPATHRAPMGRNFEGQYLNFCFEHVSEYNKTYNYFSGLDDESVARFQKDALTGHRPTWTMGVNRWGSEPPLGPAGPAAATGAEARIRARISGGRQATSATARKLRTLEQKAFDDLGLPHSASPEAIKARYKELVKRHHPDANGGDRSTEDRLRQIIHAYKYLRQTGFC
jgi:curved DNA-binding protein CbpA